MGIACDFWLISGGGDGGGGGVGAGRASTFRSTPRACAVGARMPTWCPSRPPTSRAWWGGITTIEGFCRRVAGVSWVYGSNFPRLAVGVPDAVLKLQTTLTKNAENGVLWARWTTL